jgi:hypothetical protein
MIKWDFCKMGSGEVAKKDNIFFIINDYLKKRKNNINLFYD